MIRRAITLALVVGLATAQPSLAPAQTPARETAVKATHLVRFAAFIGWPPSATAEVEAKGFNLCVAGTDPFGRALTDAARGQTAHGGPIVILRVSTAAQASRCHLIYVGEGGAALVAQIGGAAPVLRVTDEASTSRPGMIHFMVRQGRVRFTVDNGAARRAGLEVGGRLLALALAVES